MVVDIPAAHTSPVALLRWSSGGRHLLSWGVNGSLIRWQLARRSVTDGPVAADAFGFALSPDGRWLAYGGGPDGYVQLGERRGDAPPRSLAGYEFPLPGVLLFSHDSRRLAQVGAYQVIVWDVASGNEVARLEERTGLSGRIGSVAFTDEGILLACVTSARDPKVAVWDLMDRRVLWRGDNDEFDALHLAPDGRLVACRFASGASATQRVAVIDLSSGEQVGEVELAGSPFGPQSFTADGRWLVAQDTDRQPLDAVIEPFGGRARPRANATLLARSFPDGAKQLRIEGPSAPTAFALDAQGRLLAIGYQDGVVMLWDVRQSEEIFRAGFCSQAVSQLAFTTDGRSLAITDGVSPIQFFDVSMVRRQLAEIGLAW
jgi:WD40 repeat protein